MSKKNKLKPFKVAGTIKGSTRNEIAGKKKSKMRLYIVFLLIIAIGTVVYFMIKTNPRADGSALQETVDAPFTKEGELAFISRGSSDTLATIDIEIADNNQKRARGLMYRHTLPENGGMLFIHDHEEVQGFWMKNTYIPLDILFVNKEKEIVTIHMNTTPMKEWSYASSEPALYVVEVNAGFTSRYSVNIGDSIEFIVLK